ncbi:MAG: hypothetical protein O7D91_01955 [Planctomycetota bacterium]|nr:hypothetical protein [Planctomycetota bacterium]
MDVREAVWRQAESDLTVRTADGQIDGFIWEHAQRICVSSAAITDLLGMQPSSADRDVLAAAALYQDAAWAVQFAEGSISRADILAKPLTMVQREISADKSADALRDIFAAKRLESVGRIIREAGGRKTTNMTAQVVADATNLDSIGPLALFQMIHKQLEDGRAIRAILETWDRQQEYHFWPARIKESLRSEPVRRIARQRLEALSTFMNALRIHTHAEDLTEAAAQSRSKPVPFE